MKADVGEYVSGECGGTKMVRLRHFSCLLLCIMHIGIEDAKKWRVWLAQVRAGHLHIAWRWWLLSYQAHQPVIV
jgi:hypothetical protein